MDAKITYKVANLPHPWDAKRRESGMWAWCLVKVTQPILGPRKEEPVAIFDLNSEAETFMAHVYADGQDGKLVDIDPTTRELLFREIERRNGGSQ